MISSVLHSQGGFLSAVELLSSSTVSGAVRPVAAPSPLLPVCAYSDTPSADGASRSAPGSACSSAIGKHSLLLDILLQIISLNPCLFLSDLSSSIHLFVCRPIEQSIHLFIPLSIYLPVHPSINYIPVLLLIHPSIHLSNSISVHPSFSLSTKSPTHPLIHPYIYR